MKTFHPDTSTAVKEKPPKLARLANANKGERMLKQSKSKGTHEVAISARFGCMVRSKGML